MTRPLDITSFGAVGDGKTDNTKAIQYALQVGKAQCQSVLVPCGVFNYSDVLESEVPIYGEGDGSVLYSTDTDRCSIYVRGAGGGVRKLRLTGEIPTERTSNPESRRILVLDFASDFLIFGVTIDSGSGSGIFVYDDSHNGRVFNNRVSNTLADSIHMSGRCHHIIVERNVIRNSGDDGVAVVSYRDQGSVVHDIEARFNDIRDNKGGRGMSVVGGENVLYEYNYIANNRGGAGLIFAQEDSYDTFAARNVIARRNTIQNCGNPEIDHAAVMITTDSEHNDSIHIDRNVVHFDPDVENCGGLRDRSEDTNIVFDSNVIANATPPYRINYPDNVRVVEYAEGPVGQPGKETT